MNITKKVAYYEDACKILGLNPENLPVVNLLPGKDQKSIIAYHKLIIITRALNEGWEADFSNYDQCKYWAYLWVASTGFVNARTTTTTTYACVHVGSRLCFKNRELAEYAIDKFHTLYEEYLLMK